MNDVPVFYDPRGKRRKRVAWWVAGFALILAVASTAFILSLFVVPLLPRIKGLSDFDHHQGHLVPRLPDVDKRRALFLASKEREALKKQILEDRHRLDLQRATAHTAQSGSPIVAAFFAPWQEPGVTSFRDNASRLTHVMPYWLHLDANDPSRLDLSDFDTSSYSKSTELIDIARRNGVRIWPVLGNNHDDNFDPKLVRALLDSPERQQVLAAHVRDWLVRNRFDGLNVDFENLSPSDYHRLPKLLDVLRKTLRTSGLGLSIDLEAGNEIGDVRNLAGSVDLVIAMMYDEHYESGKPGPIASIEWTDHLLERFGQAVPSNKLVVGLGSYAYDWPSGQNAESVSYQEALKAAEGYRDEEPPSDVLELDPDSLNTKFDYQDDDGKSHQVWMLDGVSVFNQWQLSRKLGLRGAALWLLGQEDPSVWDVLDRHSIESQPDPRTLETVRFGPNEPEYRGQGEILYVQGNPHDASRELEIDKDSGLVVDEKYLGYPSGLYVTRKGYGGPKTLALTFDDGPDPKWTPAILDALKELHVPATFFVIGRNAEASPELVRRMVDEGHEVGSHTFNHPNMSEISDRRAELELNATERVIEGITGRETILFRPPYNADSEPTKPDELEPIVLASKLGYVTVGESLDPQDWRLGSNVDGTGPPRDAADIANQILGQLAVKEHGNAILLHDGGGDRSRTVAALKLLVPKLRAQGYRFVPVSTLLRTNLDAVMPPISSRDRALIGFDKFAFGTIFTLDWLLRIGFLAAIAFGLTRILLIIPLALVQNRRKPVASPTFVPGVSVLIAAYNEEKVIVRTIRSILASEYPVSEIVVVDDGSSDGTLAEVVSAFAEVAKVVAFKQENAGKAAALNHAMAEASGEIVVCIDADTQLKSDAIGLLVRHFEDPKVGAVAGNVKVGNRINLLTHWQSVEYITSQNLDRRAYGLLNAISVCPGAIGAWRRAAVTEVGGYLTDTLAEDMDLTWRLQAAEWKIETESSAIAYTEAPDTLRGFFKQRFRWAFGTLQCLIKHRRSLGRHGWFGWVTLPALWLFQIVFQILAPLVDLQLAYTSVMFLLAWATRSEYSKDWRPVADVSASLVQIGFLYGLFFAVELVSGFIAYRLDRERARSLWWLFLQRFVYRQVMYLVIYKSIATAIRGHRQGWGKLERKATVSSEPPVARVG